MTDNQFTLLVKLLTEISNKLDKHQPTEVEPPRSTSRPPVGAREVSLAAIENHVKNYARSLGDSDLMQDYAIILADHICDHIRIHGMFK